KLCSTSADVSRSSTAAPTGTCNSLAVAKSRPPRSSRYSTRHHHCSPTISTTRSERVIDASRRGAENSESTSSAESTTSGNTKPPTTTVPRPPSQRGARHSAIAASTSTSTKIAVAPANSSQAMRAISARSEEHTSELQSRENLVCRLLLEKKNSK